MPADVQVAGARTFGNIQLAGQSAVSGALSISPAGFGWKARESGRQVTVAAGEVESLQWVRGGNGQQVRIRVRGGSTVLFEGFREGDFDGLDEYFSTSFGKKLVRGSQAVRGWSWGQLDFVGGGAPSLVFNAGGGQCTRNKAPELEEAFEVPIGTVGNVQLPNKNELVLDVNVDDTAGKMDEELIEVRFFLPDEQDAEEMLNKVKARADTSAFAGESICSFHEVGISVPRGRFEVDMYPNHVKLHGKSVDFKILYSSVKRLFLLPKPDEILVSFVMSLEPPIRQGNTMYPHIVFQFETDRVFDVELAVSAEDLEKRYKGKLAHRESGESWRVFSKIMKHLSKSPLHLPKNFKTSKGAYAVRTALGANEGFLFFLESCCFFVNKPPTFIRYEDIDVVEFKRMELERRFDLSISPSSGSTMVFSNIERTEFDAIFEFLESKNVPIDNADVLRATGGAAKGAMVLDDDDASDESDDDDFDPEAAKRKGTHSGGGEGRDEEEDGDSSSGGDEDNDGSEDDEEFGEDDDARQEALDLMKDHDTPKSPKRKKKKTK